MNPQTADQPAGSAPAPDPLDHLTTAQREHWELTGELPSDAKPDDEGSADQPSSAGDSPAPSDSAPDKPVDQAASTDANETPDSEPGTPAKQGAETRKAQLAAEIQDLLAERAALRQEVRGLREDPSPKADAKAAESSPATAEKDPRPQPGDYPDDYEKYIEALSRWGARQEHKQIQSQTQQEQRLQQHFSQFDRMRQEAVARVEAAQKDDPSFSDRVNPQLLEITPASLVPPKEAIGPHNVIAEQILRSDQTAPLLEHFSAHPEDFRRLTTLAPHDLLREFGRLEARLAPAASPKQPVTVSAAPKPPAVLGRKPSSEGDPALAAVERGDWSAYERAMNAAETSHLKK